MMKGYVTFEGYMGFIDNMYILFDTEQEYIDFYKNWYFDEKKGGE